MLGLVAERVKIGDEIVGLTCLQHIAERRHLFAAVLYLRANLVVGETPADS
jgi:hypothetical protein